MKAVRLSLAVLLLCASLTAVAQTATPPATAPDTGPKTVPTPSAALLEAWNDIGRKLTAMAEDFPADKLDYKPTPAERTFAEQLLHASGAVYYFVDAATGEKPPQGDPSREKYKTRQDIAAFVKKSFADGGELIKKRGDKGLDEPLQDPFGAGKTRFGDMAWGFVEHSGEHYGQLVVYYRLAGLVPPESRPKK